METHPIRLPTQKHWHFKHTHTHTHTMYMTLCRLKTCIIGVLMPEVPEQIMLLCTSQHRHENTSQISKDKGRGVTMPHDFRREDFWYVSSKRIYMQGLFLSWFRNIHLPIKTLEACCRPEAMYFFPKKLQREQWASDPRLASAHTRACISSQHTIHAAASKPQTRVWSSAWGS